MPKFDDAENEYTIDDLHRKWKSSGKELAELAKSVYGGELGGSADAKKKPLDRLLLAFEEFLDPTEGWAGSYLGITDVFPDHCEILNLAASGRGRPYNPAITVLESKPSLTGSEPKLSLGLLGAGVFGSLTPRTTTSKEVGGRLGSWSKDQGFLRKTLRKATKAFIKSETFEQVFSRLASREDRKRYVEYWRQHREGKLKERSRGAAYRNERAVSGEWLSSKVDSRLREIMEWLYRGTTKSADFEQIWWECLRVFMGSHIGLMLGAHDEIKARAPLYVEQIDMLRKYLSLGRVQLDFTRWDDDGYHQLRMHMIWTVRDPEFRSPWITMTEILLMQPAFAIAQELHTSYSEPKYLRQCHAPSCKKKFFTQRKTQVVCQSMPGGSSTRCRREWMNYSRFLKNLKRNPLTDWNRPEFIQQWQNKTA